MKIGQLHNHLSIGLADVLQMVTLTIDDRIADYRDEMHKHIYKVARNEQLVFQSQQFLSNFPLSPQEILPLGPIRSISAMVHWIIASQTRQVRIVAIIGVILKGCRGYLIPAIITSALQGCILRYVYVIFEDIRTMLRQTPNPRPRERFGTELDEIAEFIEALDDVATDEEILTFLTTKHSNYRDFLTGCGYTAHRLRGP
jgi:hypothetical protein